MPLRRGTEVHTHSKRVRKKGGHMGPPLQTMIGGVTTGRPYGVDQISVITGRIMGLRLVFLNR